MKKCFITSGPCLHMRNNSSNANKLTLSSNNFAFISSSTICLSLSRAFELYWLVLKTYENIDKTFINITGKLEGLTFIRYYNEISDLFVCICPCSLGKLICTFRQHQLFAFNRNMGSISFLLLIETWAASAFCL